MSAASQPGEGTDGRAPPSVDFAAFYQEAVPHVIREIRRRWNVPDAEDVAQDAFMIVLERWDWISQLEYPEAYVRRVAERLAIRHTWRARREVLRLEVVGLSVVAPDEVSQQVEDLDSITRLIGQLPKRQASTFMLMMSGATTEEIARKLDADPSTVRSNLRHARAKLAALMPTMLE